jgi:hypothetical protein
MRKVVLGLAFVCSASGLIAQAPQPPVTPPAATTPAAAEPKPGSTDLYPVKKGTKWTYRAGETSVVVQAGDSDPKTGETKLETLVGGKPVASETIKVMTDGIYRTKINNTLIDPPVKILELEMKPDMKLGAKAVGTKWQVKSKVQQSELAGEFSIAKIEPMLKIGSETYTNAVVVEGPKFSIASTETAVTYIFAPGKGVVKLGYSIAGNSTSLELQSYEEGK